MAIAKKAVRKRAEREAPEQRRALILFAARNCLSERGMRGFTLKNVAEEAKVLISLLSLYFGSVEELLKSVFRSVLLEARPGDYTKPRNLAEALSNLQARVAKNFDPDYCGFAGACPTGATWRASAPQRFAFSVQRLGPSNAARKSHQLHY
jgi:AcrR family transcriptional regulator